MRRCQHRAADAAHRRGAAVTLVLGPSALAVPAGLEVVRVRSAADMHAAVMQALPGQDVVVMAAAVADYRPAEPDQGKRPKDREPWTVTLEPTDDVLRELYHGARHLDLDCLVEVHDGEELERALRLDADVIGINNRNLDEGSVDVATTYELMPDVPAGKTVVAESGISSHEEIEELERVGVDAVLIGSALMRAPDPEALARELTGSDEGTREHHLP